MSAAGLATRPARLRPTAHAHYRRRQTKVHNKNTENTQIQAVSSSHYVEISPLLTINMSNNASRGIEHAQHTQCLSSTEPVQRPCSQSHDKMPSRVLSRGQQGALPKSVKFEASGSERLTQRIDPSENLVWKDTRLVQCPTPDWRRGWFWYGMDPRNMFQFWSELLSLGRMGNRMLRSR